MSVGLSHACGILTDGSLVCWGDPIYGLTDPPKGNFADLSAGYQHTCALRADGAAVCWGYNVDGQANPPADLFVAIAAGSRHTCALKENGLVRCWGASKLFDHFQEKMARAVAVGLAGTCVLTLTGSVECQSDPAYYVIHPPSGRFEQIDMGDNHGCGVRHDGSIDCWGCER